jgi:hypothetical protein
MAKSAGSNKLAKLIYRVVSTCAALGYGYPKCSLKRALNGRIDAIICDAGSMDAGPYCLGTGTAYFEREAVKRDYRHMVEAGQKIDGPVILGSCGMAGGSRNLEWMIQIAKEVFAELNVRDVKVAVIGAELDPALVIREFEDGQLLPTGTSPDLNVEALRESTIVGQMGVHPLITALESGAKYILAGRACDTALFASDMIRRGIDAGLAYHVGHVLACGALACDPGSPADCLVAEIFDDGTAVFVAPEPNRRCTPYSIAAHSLYEQSHAQLQFYPEGILATERTQFFAHDARSTGIRNSVFVRAIKPWPLSIKLEGARRVGARKVSLVHLKPADLSKVPADILVYGRNGVQSVPVLPAQRELGVIIETASQDAQAAIHLATLLTHHLIHHSYPGRKGTAANTAYPMSPNIVSFTRADGTFGAVVPSGTRDPVFLENYVRIKSAVIKRIEEEFPDTLKAASYRFIEADALHPVALLRTVDRDLQQLASRHRAEIARLLAVASAEPGSLFELEAADAYEWTLYHLIQNVDVIKAVMFPISYFRAEGAQWTAEDTARPRYYDIGVAAYTGDLNDRTLSLIADARPSDEPAGTRQLRDMAVVIRSKDAGINRLVFDIVFNSAADYESALTSNVFAVHNVAGLLGLRVEEVVGTYFVDSCNAIKLTVDRRNISASLDEHDVFGVQQQAVLEALGIPMYVDRLTQTSSF